MIRNTCHDTKNISVACSVDLPCANPGRISIEDAEGAHSPGRTAANGSTGKISARTGQIIGDDFGSTVFAR
jgi:hypothetical protein